MFKTGSVENKAKNLLSKTTEYKSIKAKLKKLKQTKVAAYKEARLIKSDFQYSGKYYVIGILIDIEFSSKNTGTWTESLAQNSLPKIVTPIENIFPMKIKQLEGLPAIKLERHDKDDNGIFVTSEFFWSTPIILKHLGLENLVTEEIRKHYDIYNNPDEKMYPLNLTESSTVYSMGEGYSGFGPFMLSLQHNFIGIDLAYGSKVSQNIGGAEFISRYKKKFESNLLFGDATDLPTTIKSNTGDLVAFHALFNYLNPTQKSRAISEAFRIIKNGGQIRISPWTEGFDEALKGARLPEGSFKIITKKFTASVEVSKFAIKNKTIPTFSFPWDEMKELLFNPTIGLPFPTQFRTGLGARTFYEDKASLIIIEKKIKTTAMTFFGE